MRILTKSFIVSAFACGASWLAKSAVLAATAGAETTLVAVLWATGMVTFLTAAATGAALLLRRSPVGVRTVGAIAAVPVAFILLNVLDSATKSVYQVDGWFRDEIALVLAALLLTALGATRASTSRTAR